MSEELQKCPSCESPYGYESGEGQYTCPECSYEWNLADLASADELVVLDANGARLQNGDSVVVVKDLPVKGAPKPVIKAGTKVKNIRLTDGDHNIGCNIWNGDAYKRYHQSFPETEMMSKEEFIKKA